MLCKILLNGFQLEKVTGSCLPSFIGLSGKLKLDLTWEVVKEGKSDPDLTFIKNISGGYYHEDEAITNFQNVSICKTKTVWILSPAY